MGTRVNRRLAALGVASLAALGLAACGSSSSPSSSGSAKSASSSSGSCTTMTPVTLQLQWQTQAQFAGYIEAGVDGFYKKQCLNVKIVPAAADTVPQLTVADGGSADFAVAWAPKALQSRQKGAGITDIGQVFQRSGTLQISFKKKSITSVPGLKGHTVGDWGYGDEYELFAGMTKAGLNPGKDVKLVQQAFTMDGFLKGDIDAAQAMIYNEYALVLESKNPATGKLYQPSNLNIINWNDVGTAMLQDGIWANTKKLQTPAFKDTAVRFLTAAYEGWITCGTQPQKCASDVVKAGSGLAPVHQLWMMNQVNKLIWPSPQGIGTVDKAEWNKTVKIAEHTKNADGQTVLSGAPAPGAYDMTYTEKALSDLKKMGLNTTGAGFKPITVTLTPGGQ
jgi:NitT/TauT family transport system substrate-binding protein